MAVAAQAREVIDGLVGRMAIGAGGEAGMIKVSRFPCGCRMTRTAFTRVVADRRIDLMSFLAMGGILVIKTGGRESHIGVAAFARQAQRLELALVLVLMAADARRRQALGLPAHVTLIAVDLRMFARKRRTMLRSQFGRQRD